MAKVNFFLVFEGRAGSGLLRSILNSGREIFFEAEWMMFDLRQHEDAGRRQNEQVASFFTDPEYADLTCLGFDNKLSDIVDPGGFADALDAHEVRIISLKRRNVAKQVISTLNALRTREVTGKFHAYNQEDILDDRFELDLDQFDAHLVRLQQRSQAIDRFVAAREWPSIEVFYEDLVKRRGSTVGSVLELLEAPADGIDLSPKGRPLKQSPTDLRELIVNFDALVERYRGTPFQPMLQDPDL